MLIPSTTAGDPPPPPPTPTPDPACTPDARPVGSLSRTFGEVLGGCTPSPAPTPGAVCWRWAPRVAVGTTGAGVTASPGLGGGDGGRGEGAVLGGPAEHVSAGT